MHLNGTSSRLLDSVVFFMCRNIVWWWWWFEKNFWRQYSKNFIAGCRNRLQRTVDASRKNYGTMTIVEMEKKANWRKTKIKFNMKCIRMRYTCHRSKCVEVSANGRPQIPKRHSIATVDVLMRGCEYRIEKKDVRINKRSRKRAGPKIELKLCKRRNSIFAL